LCFLLFFLTRQSPPLSRPREKVGSFFFTAHVVFGAPLRFPPPLFSPPSRAIPYVTHLEKRPPPSFLLARSLGLNPRRHLWHWYVFFNHTSTSKKSCQPLTFPPFNCLMGAVLSLQPPFLPRSLAFTSILFPLLRLSEILDKVGLTVWIC